MPAFTPKELEIVRLLCARPFSTEADLAAAAGVAYGTVHSHLGRIRLKLQVNDRDAIVQAALDGLIPGLVGNVE